MNPARRELLEQTKQWAEDVYPDGMPFEKKHIVQAARIGADRAYRKLERQIETLQRMIENMATQHIEFGIVGSDEKLHPDWCPVCRLEAADQLGSPAAIAAWIEETVVPVLGASMNLPEVSVEKGMAQSGASAGDLIKAIREWTVMR